MENSNNPILSNDADKEVGATPLGSEKKERPFSNLTRALSESDLKSVGVQKILLGQMDDFEKCKEDLDLFRTKYFETDKKCAQYVVKDALNVKTETLYSFLLAIGSALLGLFTGLSDCTAKWGVLIVGIITFGASIVIKIFVGNSKI